MERLSRHGQSFSLALVVIDDFDEILKALGRDEADQVIKRAAGFVRTSLRSFDGAYNMGHGEFVLSLKQASISGGQKALERLRDELEKSDVTYRIDTQYKKITMSCCVAEPLPDDDLHLLLGNLRADLGMQEKEAGTVLTYFEMSPLQQFVKTGQKD
jgi:diguanylate cyclase (GGDEF)-like protein